MKALPVLVAVVLILGLYSAPAVLAQDKTPVVTGNISGSGTPLYISPSTIRGIQKALNKEGFSTEKVDGVWGSDTESALKSFQMENNLDSTGKPDIATLTKLNIDLGLGVAPAEQAADQATPEGESVTEVEPSAGDASAAGDSNKKSEDANSTDTDQKKAYPQ